MRTYDEWKTSEPDYADYDDYDPREDPFVQLQEKAEALRLECAEWGTITARDRMMVYGVLPDLHAAWTYLGVILDQFPGTLPQDAKSCAAKT